MKPLFSVIVPVYKTEKYLHRCVDSVLEQTFENWEMILVDDGSPDGSGAICDAYGAKDGRIRVIHKENGGLVSARKAGAAVCRGEFVMNVDSDDYIAPDLMERIARVLENGAQVVLFGCQRFGGGGDSQLKSLLAEGLYEKESLQTLRNALIQNEQWNMAVLYGVCAMAVARAVYAPLQQTVPQTIRRGEDMAVTVPLLAGCECVYVLDYCGYFYRQNADSIMNTFSMDEVEQMGVLVTYLEDRLPQTYSHKLDVYVLTQYFNFLDRAMEQGLSVYRKAVCHTKDAAVLKRIRNVRGNSFKQKLVAFLLRHRMFDTLWLLRKLKPAG